MVSFCSLVFVSQTCVKRVRFQKWAVIGRSTVAYLALELKSVNLVGDKGESFFSFRKMLQILSDFFESEESGCP